MCTHAEGKPVEFFVPKQYTEHVVVKILHRINKQKKQDLYEHRDLYHPYADVELRSSIEFICYYCYRLVPDFEKSFPCPHCSFGVFCSENCRSMGSFTHHSISCVPRCFNPLCKCKGTKFFCCTEALYCSSMYFHVDLQHALSRHDCHPVRQFVVFYHRPANMTILARKYIVTLKLLAMCKFDLFKEPETLETISVQIRLCIRFYPFGVVFKDSILGRLRRVKKIDSFTHRAVWEYVYPYLSIWFFESIVRHACLQDLIALWVFEDFFHMVTCNGFINLHHPERFKKEDFDIRASSLMAYENGKGEKGCFCGVCEHRFNFDYVLWTVGELGEEGIEAPLEALRNFLHFYALHFNSVGVNEAHQIIHAFVSDRRQTLGYYNLK